MRVQNITRATKIIHTMHLHYTSTNHFSCFDIRICAHHTQILIISHAFHAFIFKYVHTDTQTLIISLAFIFKYVRTDA